jgi:alcohol dehydrogenase (cytochrome c)
MARVSAFAVSLVFVAITPAVAQVKNYKPVTRQMLLNPSPNDWLMYSRHDAWRYSPLKQINKKNVKQLRMAWVRGLGKGVRETMPIECNLRVCIAAT